MFTDCHSVRMKAAMTAWITASFIIAFEPSACAQTPETQPEPAATAQYTSEHLRDPFEAYISRDVVPMSAESLAQEENFTPPPLAITGVTWGSSFPQAIINNQVVKAGDMVGDVEVVAISKQGIIFQYNKQKFTMPLPSGTNSSNPGQGSP